MLGINFCSAVKNKAACCGNYGQREKYSPFGTLDTEKIIQQLKSLNIKVFRQILMLDEVLIGDELRTDYLDDFAAVTMQFQQHGKVILDFHQDIFSRQFGGCGLPNKYMPAELRGKIVVLENGGKAWGGTPITSKEQCVAWDYFYANCAPQYSQDINKVINYLATRLPRFYDYVDLINEPSCSAMYHCAFLRPQRRSQESAKLSSFYNFLLQNLPPTNKLDFKVVVEPLNYDVSQIAGMPFGLQPLRSDRELVYGPHLYEPVLSKKKAVMLSHLLQQQKLGCKEIMIGEFGDLTNGGDPARFRGQLELFQQLDVLGCIWELNPIQLTENVVQEQDKLPWNCEVMSILKGYELTRIGEQIQLPKVKKIKFSWRNEEDLKIEGDLRVYWVKNKWQKFRFWQKFRIEEQVGVRILALKAGFSVQFVGEVVFSEIDLGNGRKVVEEEEYVVME